MLSEPQWSLIFGSAKRRGAKWQDLADVNAYKREIDAAVRGLTPSQEIATTIEQSSKVHGLTVRILQEIVEHEAIILEAYKDSKGIWTWGVGVTSASGHSVERYKDNPQTLEHVLEIYAWLLRTKYLPDVLKAFGGQPLTESQLAAALSFHYNTGAIKRASWVKSWLSGEIADARVEFMEWRKPAEIVERRAKERDLFFDGQWTGNGEATVFQVRKPSYAPKWGSAKQIDITQALKEVMV